MAIMLKLVLLVGLVVATVTAAHPGALRFKAQTQTPGEGTSSEGNCEAAGSYTGELEEPPPRKLLPGLGGAGILGEYTPPLPKTAVRCKKEHGCSWVCSAGKKEHRGKGMNGFTVYTYPADHPGSWRCTDLEVRKKLEEFYKMHKPEDLTPMRSKQVDTLMAVTGVGPSSNFNTIQDLFKKLHEKYKIQDALPSFRPTYLCQETPSPPSTRLGQH